MSSTQKNVNLGVPNVQALRQKAVQSLNFVSRPKTLIPRTYANDRPKSKSVIAEGAPKKGVDQVESSSGIKSRLASKFPKQVSRKNIPAECYYTFQ
ncbi:hypothetical protein D9615_006341 [Tricholomella constricta]|uniref:Uncharacterized protein n=1 Tax=Tricholomella constricta TaxID=117010 RepID=A0A8H5H5Y4_9AGAR|nr:hypothetical protein D9615_006341 [Tricholomella constricta]